MRTLPDRNLTANFSLYELIEAHPTGNRDLAWLNWKFIGELDMERLEMIAARLQQLRDIINQRYRVENFGKEIALRVTSAFRCRAWERLRNRNGSSRHVVCDANDFVPVCENPEQTVLIIEELYRELNPRLTGHQGGLAIKKPTRNAKGELQLLGFMHIDLGPTRRWEYL